MRYVTAFEMSAPFIGSRSLRTVGLGDLSDFAATLTGSAASRRRTLSAIKALLTTGFKMGALRFNVGAALRLPYFTRGGSTASRP
jgi:hypothetical protein